MPFDRSAVRHRFAARRAVVTAVSRPVEGMIRVTLDGEDFADFASSGPADHVRLYLPDEATGALVAPTTDPSGEGLIRPEGTAIHRDYTPLPSETGALDLDFVDHVDPGPATRWARAAAVGDEVVVVGPRGSKGAPDVERMLAIVDETALPSTRRWLAARVGLPTRLLAQTDRDAAWVAAYLGLPAEVAIVPRGDGLAAAIPAIGPEEFVFAAGEASAMAAVRRELLGTRGLDPAQLAISGYWRRGEIGFDHHSPLPD